MSQKTETPRHTLVAATRMKALPASKLVLLGTIIKPDSVRALVRLGKNDVKYVSVGDLIGGATVVAIDEGIMVLSQHSRIRRLHLPGA